MCVKPRRPFKANVGTKTAFRHGLLQEFSKKSKHLLRLEVTRSEFMQALPLDKLNADGSRNADSPRSSRDCLITMVKTKNEMVKSNFKK